MKRYFSCDTCGVEFDWYHSVYTIMVEDTKILNALAKLNSDFALNFKGTEVHICERCFDKAFSRCIICDEVLVKGDLCDCHQDHVLNYHNKGTIFHNHSGHVKFPKLYMGLEVETILRGSACLKKKEVLLGFSRTLGKGYCKFKQDGSLGARGVEVVTMPMQYEGIMASKYKWAKAWKEFKRFGYSRNDTRTGCHIHLSRNAFLNKKHIENFFIGICKSEGFTSRIANRKTNIFCMHPKEVTRGYNGIQTYAHEYVYKDWHCERHQMVNLNNKNTVEVRVYKGDTDWFNVLSYVQHCYSMFEYTLKVTLNKTKVRLDEYIDYVKRNNQRFEYLVKKI